MHAPDLSAPADWTPAQLPHLIYAHPDSQFLVGDPAEGRVCVRYFRKPDGHLGGKIWFGPRAEGPPGHAHGGAIAAVLDEVMGGAAWLAGHPVMTIDMAVRYRKAVPLNAVYTVHGAVERVEGRKVHMTGRLVQGEHVLATSTGVFLVMTHNPFAGLKS